MSLKISHENLLKNLIILFGTITIIFSNKAFLDPNEYLEFEYEGTQYGDTDEYLEISKNFSRMGPMISGKEGQYEIHSIGWNDSAFPILISSLAFFGIEFHSFSELVFINYVLFWFSLLCFSLLFLRKSPWVFGIIQLLTIHYIYQTGFENSMLFVDQHSTIPALAILTFLLVEVLFKNKNRPTWKLFTLAFCGGLFGMFRNYFTYVFIFLIGLFSKKMLKLLKTKNNKLGLFICPLLAIVIVINFSGMVQRGFYYYAHLRNPDLYIHQPPHKHGIWFNAYLGLGALKNKWKIGYWDDILHEHAQWYEPTIELWSQRQYVVMRKLYFKYLSEEPVEYIKNHIKKSYIVAVDVIRKNCYLIMIFFLTFLYGVLKFKRRIFKKKFFLKSAHIIPLFMFFIVPVITLPDIDRYAFAITNYASLIIITLNAKLLDVCCENKMKGVL